VSEKPLVKITIDGNEMQVPAGTSVLKAAAQLGKEVPHFCYHEGLPVVGQCRMCYVEIEGMPKLATSCSTIVNEGMKVSTDSPKVKQGQNATLEFILLDHPLDCPICDRGGECKLQDYTYEHGPSRSRMIDEKEALLKHQPISANVILDQERCILCTRCVRFSSHVDGLSELVVNERGSHSCINVFDDRPMESKFQGNVVDLCPVGALTATDYRFKARPWELKKHEAICTGCSMGCNIEIHTKHRHPGITRPDGLQPKPKIERLIPRENTQVNDWWMCDRGRWGYHFHNSEENRLHEPRIRRKAGEDFSQTSFKEIQLVLEDAWKKSNEAWEFWVSDEASHEEIQWAKDLKKSWIERGRNVSDNFNPSDFSGRVVSVLAGRAVKPETYDINKITHFVSVCTDYRAFEDEVAMLALKVGQKIRHDGAQWSQRELSAFANSSDDLASTLYLVPAPTTEAELNLIEKLPREAQVIILWKKANSRGLLEEGIAPLESLEAQFAKRTPKGPVFVFGQTSQTKKSSEFAAYLKAASFVVLMDSFLSSWSEHADIVLPVEALYESHCHLTNILGMKQNSKGVQIRHANLSGLSRGSESPVNPSLRLI